MNIIFNKDTYNKKGKFTKNTFRKGRTTQLNSHIILRPSDATCYAQHGPTHLPLTLALSRLLFIFEFHQLFCLSNLLQKKHFPTSQRRKKPCNKFLKI